MFKVRAELTLVGPGICGLGTGRQTNHKALTMDANGPRAVHAQRTRSRRSVRLRLLAISKAEPALSEHPDANPPERTARSPRRVV